MDEVKDEVEVKDVDVKDAEVTFQDGLLNGVSRALTWLTHVRQPVLAVSASTYPRGWLIPMTVEVQVVVGEYEGQQRTQQKKLSIY